MGLYGAPKLVMPRGKYAGQPIENVPCEYLEWALEEWVNIRPDLQTEMENQVLLKRGEGVSRGKAE